MKSKVPFYWHKRFSGCSFQLNPPNHDSVINVFNQENVTVSFTCCRRQGLVLIMLGGERSLFPIIEFCWRPSRERLCVCMDRPHGAYCRAALPEGRARSALELALGVWQTRSSVLSPMLAKHVRQPANLLQAGIALESGARSGLLISRSPKQN